MASSNSKILGFCEERAQPVLDMASKDPGPNNQYHNQYLCARKQSDANEDKITHFLVTITNIYVGGPGWCFVLKQWDKHIAVLTLSRALAMAILCFCPPVKQAHCSHDAFYNSFRMFYILKEKHFTIMWHQNRLSKIQNGKFNFSGLILVFFLYRKVE